MSSRRSSKKIGSKTLESTPRLNIIGSLTNKKNEVSVKKINKVLARKLERESERLASKLNEERRKKLRNIIRKSQLRKKMQPINNGLPRPYTHSSASSRSRKPIVLPNELNLMERGYYTPRSRYTPRRNMGRMTPIQENDGTMNSLGVSSTSVKRRPTTFSEYFQNVANEAREESRKLNSEERFSAYMSSLKNEIAAENEAERMEHERIKSERNQLRRKKKENKSVKYSVKAHRQLLDSYMPVHQVFNKRARAPTSKGRKLYR